ncbi:MAG: sugar phosphate nucleotidyltransferase [Dehalococcoidia bacterium]|nr:sugar phosphate nucleotidyltransferase [Dehalococcoidia bacterium]
MKALFLCGGIGKRMAPLAEDKFLIKFLGKTLLEHQLDAVKSAGLNRVAFVCNPHNHERVKTIAAGTPGISTELAVQREPRGIADTLESAAHLLDDEVLIINPDDIFEASALTSLLLARSKHKAKSYLVGYKVKSYFPGGYLVTDEKGQLTHIVEKPGKGNEPSDMVNLLVHLHTEPRLLLKYISRVQTDRDDRYERALDMMCQDGKSVRVVPYAGPWQAIKYPWNILDGVRYFLDRAEGCISRSAQISSNAVIEGKVVIADNVRILENAVVRGPVYLGAGTIVGNSTLVRGYSHIGADCVIGFGTEIKGSYIGDDCGFHMNYIGDSIIGERCNFGAGTITANWRFDEQPVSVGVGNELVDTGIIKFGAIVGNNCRTGINVSIMPGVKIGSNSFIGPATCLTKDITADTMVVGHALARSTRKSPRTH